MTVVIDTNVILDIVEQRDNFFDQSYAVVQLAGQGKIDCILSASAVTDIYYLARRNFGNTVEARAAIIQVSNLVRICDTKAQDISDALALNVSDFEDAVVASVANREGAEYIVTRNTKDFCNSPVPAVTPDSFLDSFQNQ